MWLCSHTLPRVVRIKLDIAASRRAVTRPVCAIRLDRRHCLAIGHVERDRRGERFKLDMDSALSRVARFAEADKIFLDHCAALRLRNDMPAMIRFPRPARDAARERGHDVGADRGGDAGLGGHDSGSFRCR